ncbi:hypothetical protein LINGRAHAP2_LOCUS4902, partial [Linum grandiflorum]
LEVSAVPSFFPSYPLLHSSSPSSSPTTSRRRRPDSFSPSVTATAAEGRPPPLYSSSDYDDLRRKTLAGARLRRGRVNDELRPSAKDRGSGVVGC